MNLNHRNHIVNNAADKSSIKQFFIDTYDVYKFILRFFKEVFRPPYEFKEIVRQCYYIGYKSVALISISGFITGIVFTKHSRPALAQFGATSWLPSLIGIAVIRALAPLITALIAAGKIGSNIGAELGSMKVTEQIDAMEVSGTKPFKFLVCTRVIACTLMVPALMLYNGFIAIMGSFLNIHHNELMSLQAFYQEALFNISFVDIATSIVKAVVYGFTIGMTGCYQGYSTTQGTEGVGRAANSAVVVSMFLLFIEEVVIVQLVNTIRPPYT